MEHNKDHELLKQAVGEIRQLRSQNQLMSARLEMFDTMIALLHTELAQKSQCMSPDICYEIEKHIEPKASINN